jgi:hypothetical protein
MSYEQREVSFVGRIFDGNDELLKFLLKNNAISQELVDEWSEELEIGERVTNLLDPSNILILDFPELQDVDNVGTEEMFVGYIIATKFVSRENFDKEVEKAKIKWKAIFNEDAELEQVIQYI